jgi:hypothetical protein
VACSHGPGIIFSGSRSGRTSNSGPPPIRGIPEFVLPQPTARGAKRRTERIEASGANQGGIACELHEIGRRRKFVVPEPAIAVLADHRAVQDDHRRLFGPDYQEYG